MVAQSDDAQPATLCISSHPQHSCKPCKPAWCARMFLNRNADRKRNVAMKKLCIAGAAYRIENANLFFTSSRPMHGKNVLQRTAGAGNPSRLIIQAIGMMEKIAAAQDVARCLLNRSSRTSRKVP